jgi:hypothetical protein
MLPMPFRLPCNTFLVAELFFDGQTPLVVFQGLGVIALEVIYFTLYVIAFGRCPGIVVFLSIIMQGLCQHKGTVGM